MTGLSGNVHCKRGRVKLMQTADWLWTTRNNIFRVRKQWDFWWKKIECTPCSIIYGLPLHEFCIGQVDRASARCLGGHRFESCQGLRFFLCPTLMTCWLFYFSPYYFCCHIVICFVKKIVISLCFILIDGKNVSFALYYCFLSILIKSVFASSLSLVKSTDS